MDWVNLAKLVGGGAGAVFTGGATLPIAMQGAAGLLGNAAKGAAQERGLKNTSAQGNYQTRQQAALQALLAQGRDKMDAYGTRQGATSNAAIGQSQEGLARARLGVEAPSMRARQSVLGSLMKNLQPTSVSVPEGQRGHETKISGGLSPSALDPMTRQHGAALMKAALEAQLSGSDVPAATDFSQSILDVPEATDYSKGVMLPPEYQEAGKGESIMSGLGTALGLAGAVGGAFAKQPPKPPVEYDYGDQQYGWGG